LFISVNFLFLYGRLGCLGASFERAFCGNLSHQIRSHTKMQKKTGQVYYIPQYTWRSITCFTWRADAVRSSVAAGQLNWRQPLWRSGPWADALPIELLCACNSRQPATNQNRSLRACRLPSAASSNFLTDNLISTHQTTGTFTDSATVSRISLSIGFLYSRAPWRPTLPCQWSSNCFNEFVVFRIAATLRQCGC